jgi:hypothetical protein
MNIPLSSQNAETLWLRNELKVFNTCNMTTMQIAPMVPPGEFARIAAPNSDAAPLLVQDISGRVILTVTADGKTEYDPADTDEVIRRLAACTLTLVPRPDIWSVREKLLQGPATS